MSLIRTEWVVLLGMTVVGWTTLATLALILSGAKGVGRGARTREHIDIILL